jgi:hypothetical protein
MNDVSIIINGVRYDLEIPLPTIVSRCNDCELREMCDDGDYYNQTICEKLQCIIGVFKKSDKKFER